MSLPARPSTLLFLLLLSIPPRPLLNPSSLLWPLTLLRYPPNSPTLAHLPLGALRTISVARALEHYAISWLALLVLDAGIKTFKRVRRIRSDRQEKGKRVDGLEVKRILSVKASWRSVIWHAMAWRLVVLPTGQGGGKIPVIGGEQGVDLGMLVGVIGGLIASWGEVGRLLALFGWKKDPQTGPSWTLSITHVVLSIHRLLLGIRILSAGISATGLVGA